MTVTAAIVAVLLVAIAVVAWRINAERARIDADEADRADAEDLAAWVYVMRHQPPPTMFDADRWL